jgi:hypothetical protein
MSYRLNLFRSTTIATGLALTSPALSQEINFSSIVSMQASIISMAEGTTDVQRKESGKAIFRILISRHPLTKNLEGFSALMAFGSLGKAFYTGAGDAFDGITREVVQAEIVAFKVKNETRSKEIAASSIIADTLLACLQSKATLANPRFESTDGVWFKLDITNNLPWAIRGYHVAYTISGDGRSVPVKEDDSSMDISGGIEPNETRTANVWAGANIAEYQATSIEVSLINLFDVKNRRMVENNTNYLDRPSDISPNTCE